MVGNYCNPGMLATQLQSIESNISSGVSCDMDFVVFLEIRLLYYKHTLSIR
jgi:hypothetical protein